MTLDQKRQFQVSCHEALIDLATKYREEMQAMKADMDLAGVFHPDANAHRAHCMYLLKIYKNITSDNIEDPILRKMKNSIHPRSIFSKNPMNKPSIKKT